jgi:hypothetical protein
VDGGEGVTVAPVDRLTSVVAAMPHNGVKVKVLMGDSPPPRLEEVGGAASGAGGAVELRRRDTWRPFLQLLSILFSCTRFFFEKGICINISPTVWTNTYNCPIFKTKKILLNI